MRHRTLLLDEPITADEVAAAALAARGHTNPEIAARLGITLGMVVHRLRSATAKTGTTDRGGLTLALLRAGYLVFDSHGETIPARKPARRPWGWFWLLNRPVCPAALPDALDAIRAAKAAKEAAA